MSNLFKILSDSEMRSKGIDPTSIKNILPSDKELDIPPRMNGDLAEPGPYEPIILNGQYRCDICGFYFDPDEGEWVDGQFRCRKDKEEIEHIEREERKSKCLP